MAAVDLLVNCFERSYRDVLAPGFFAGLMRDNRRDFAMRTALINNVEDRADAEARAQALVASGELTRYRFVEDHLDDALRRTGVTREELEPVPYFTDWPLVAVTLDGPDWLLAWDADVRLRAPADWVTPAIELMERDRRVLVATPMWPVPNLPDFTFETQGPFALGHGFSDQVFLGRRSELGQPIYQERTIALWRYPFSHVTAIFEARVDAHLRRRGRLRAVHRDVVYDHGVEQGTSWPAATARERLRARRNLLVIDVLRHLPWRPRHLRQL